MSEKTALPAEDALTPDREAEGDVAPAVPRETKAPDLLAGYFAKVGQPNSCFHDPLSARRNTYCKARSAYK